MSRNEPYELSEPDLMDLRDRMARVGFISDGVGGVLAQAPWITYILSDHTYALHSGGFTVAISDRDEVVCALLRNERLEPGFCRRVLDPTFDVQQALRTAEHRAAYARDRALEAAQQRQEREARDEAARRRKAQLRLPDPTTVSLDDLFS